MALRIPILRTQRKFSGLFVVDNALNAIANAPGLYEWPAGNVANMGVIFGGSPFSGPVVGRRITRMVVKTKTNEPRGTWQWAPIILVGPSEARYPINGWQTITNFCYDPTYPLIPPEGYFEYEYLYDWPSGLPPTAYGVELRGVSGTMPVTPL